MQHRIPERSLGAFLPVVALLFSGCLAALPDSESLPVEQACLISGEQAVPIIVEIARTSAERSRGLMDRARLAPHSGMLFVYNDQRRSDHGFWMYRTLIPLDIAYLDRDGVIGAIRHMVPCPSDRGRDCPTYQAGVPFYRALEMNLGYFEREGINVGDQLSLEAADCR